MDPKVRPTHYKPMTPSTSSSGSTVFVKPKKQFCALPGRLGCLTPRDLSPVPPPGAESYREKQNLSRWTNQTVTQTVAWTQARSASTVSAWNRQTLPVGTAGTSKATSDRSKYLLEVALRLTCTVFAFHSWNSLEKHFLILCERVDPAPYLCTFVPSTVTANLSV